MLDFGWSEFFLIMVLAIVLMGPKDIPHLVYQFGRLVRRLQYMKFALSRQFDDFMEQNDLNELRKGQGLGDLKGDVRQAMMVPLPSVQRPSVAPVTSEAVIPPASVDTIEADEDEAYHSEMPLDPQPIISGQTDLFGMPLESGRRPQKIREDQNGST